MGCTVESSPHATLLLRSLHSRRKAPPNEDVLQFDLTNQRARFQERNDTSGANEFVGQDPGRSRLDDRSEFTPTNPMPIEFMEQRESLALGRREHLRFHALFVDPTVVQQRHASFRTSSQNLRMTRSNLGQPRMGERAPSLGDTQRATRSVVPKKAADCDEASSAARRLNPSIQGIAVLKSHCRPWLRRPQQGLCQPGEIIEPTEHASHVVERGLRPDVTLHVNDIF
jgi:hypothetical protein